MYYSWYNISSVNKNNTFTYVWFDSSGSLNKKIEVTIPDGFYTVNTLNEYLQSIFVKNGHYLINSDGKYIYYIELQTNSTYYSVQLNIYPMIKNTESSNYTQGSTNWGYPTENTTPQIIFNDFSTFRDLIGFLPITYPEFPSANIQTFLSTNTPRMNPVSSIFIKCSLCNNVLSTPDNILYSFTTGDTAFGSMIVVEPKSEIFLKIKNQSVYDLRIEFVDQDLKQLFIKDAQMVIVLSIKEENEIV
jgi:hypothetical protein